MTELTYHKILAIDTSTQACSVSLKIGSNFYTEFALTPQTHANNVLPMIDNVLKKANLSGDELDCLALSEGPGAFTGIRIAAGVIQGLAFGWKLPVVNISTLEALAWPIAKKYPNTNVAACLDARMNELYFQVCCFREGEYSSDSAQLLSEQNALSICAKRNITVGIGDIQKDFPHLVSTFQIWEDSLPNAETVALLAEQRIHLAQTVSNQLPEPIYLRNNVAEKPKRINTK